MKKEKAKTEKQIYEEILTKEGPELSYNHDHLSAGTEVGGGIAINKDVLCFTKSEFACTICKRHGHAKKEGCEL